MKESTTASTPAPAAPVVPIDPSFPGPAAPIRKSSKLNNVCYDIRGPILKEAHRLEEEGHRVTKLNIGNPAPFGFDAPEEILLDVVHNLPASQGYCDAKGIYTARKAVMQYAQQLGIGGVGVDDIFIGNGVSELVMLALQGLLENGDEVLLPAPDFPLWSAAVNLCGGKPVHYRCDEDDGWAPVLADLAALVTPRTRALVVINPNNPTGAVYERVVLEHLAAFARRYGLVVFADEIYDKIVYDDAQYIPFASVADDLPVVTFSGLSKSYRAAGFRTGWMIVSGARQRAGDYIEGLNILASLRLCSNVPTQHAVQAALGGHQSIRDLVRPGGRLLEQRDLGWQLLTDIEGISCVKPRGALYLFARLDTERFNIVDDERFVLDLLRREKILVVQGSAFNWPRPDHFRIVFLPHAEDLRQALGRFAPISSAVSPICAVSDAAGPRLSPASRCSTTIARPSSGALADEVLQPGSGLFPANQFVTHESAEVPEVPIRRGIAGHHTQQLAPPHFPDLVAHDHQRLRAYQPDRINAAIVFGCFGGQS